MDTTTPIARSTFLEFKANQTLAARNRLALIDLREGWSLLPLSMSLGWLDIRLRYRGSALGPFWLTLSTAVMVGSLGFLYAHIFQIEVAGYLPYLALSLVLCGFLAAIVSEACTAFTDAEGVIRAVRMPFFVFAARTLIRNLLVLAHNILVIVVVFAIFLIWPGWHGLLALPGLLLWGIDALALTLLLGTFCARFRDILPIVASIMQIAFFVTPVIWKPGQLGAGAVYLPLSPFYDMLQIVRAPMLGESPGLEPWLGAMVYSLLLCGVAWSFFVRARGRIAFWI